MAKSKFQYGLKSLHNENRSCHERIVPSCKATRVLKSEFAVFSDVCGYRLQVTADLSGLKYYEETVNMVDERVIES